MAVNVTLSNVTNLQDTTTAQNTINNNNSTLTTALVDALSRSGSTPNTMSTNLDMNNNRILNLSAPGSQNEPVRLADVTTGTVLTPTVVFASPTAKVGTSATNGSATTAMRSDASPPLDLTLSASWTGFHSFSPSSGLTSGMGISGTNLIARASGISVNLPTVNSTLIGTSTTDVLTNKTLTSASLSGGSINNAILTSASLSGATLTTANIVSASLQGTFTGTYNFSGSPTLTGASVINSGISGGTINNTTIGTGTAAAGVFTSVTGTTIIATSSLLDAGTGGLGYTAGTGGASTQGGGSGKGTSLTANQLTAQITLNNANLAAGASTTFKVLNNLVGANDVIFTNIINAGSRGNMQAWVSDVSSGAFWITLKGGSAEAVANIVAFTVLKGATS